MRSRAHGVPGKKQVPEGPKPNNDRRIVQHTYEILLRQWSLSVSVFIPASKARMDN